MMSYDMDTHSLLARARDLLVAAQHGRILQYHRTNYSSPPPPPPARPSNTNTGGDPGAIVIAAVLFLLAIFVLATLLRIYALVIVRRRTEAVMNRRAAAAAAAGGSGPAGGRGRKSKGLDPEVVRSFPTEEVTASWLEEHKGFGDCAVCLVEFGVGDSAKILPCHHLFHSACVDPWLTSKGSCPLCRRVDLVDPSDDHVDQGTAAGETSEGGLRAVAATPAAESSSASSDLVVAMPSGSQPRGESSSQVEGPNSTLGSSLHGAADLELGLQQHQHEGRT